MIPVSDSVPTRHAPWVNYAIVVSCALVFLFELALGPQLDGLIRRWGVTPLLVSQTIAGNPAVPHAELLTLVTALFLHGGWLHLLGNMVFLWVFGDNVEERLGHLRYLVFYLACGVAANLAQVYIDPGSRVPLIGASGAIAAVLGSYIVMFPGARVTVLVPVFFIPLFIPVPAFVMLGVWFITQLANGVTAITTQAQVSGGVGWWAHIGGFALGAVLTPLLPKARSRQEVYRPLAVPPPRQMRQVSPVGAAVIRAVTLAGDIVNALLTLRILLAFLALPLGGLLSFLERLVYALSWPLVQPFTAFLPFLEFGGHVLELYSILAFLVYYSLVAATAWVLGLAFARGRVPYG
ncbi:MAG: rhomboid family intramembrane serine protease [Chloroflexi bacterium]|nr:rhomboid family intramembrane serine protease [Chloroflexota bacterium]MCL5108147.1 rhomboid family intramembrane serine protease [Chloroflexota bacterium]